jgi:hypothetical protein
VVAQEEIPVWVLREAEAEERVWGVWERRVAWEQEPVWLLRASSSLMAPWPVRSSATRVRFLRRSSTVFPQADWHSPVPLRVCAMLPLPEKPTLPMAVRRREWSVEATVAAPLPSYLLKEGFLPWMQIDRKDPDSFLGIS